MKDIKKIIINTFQKINQIKDTGHLPTYIPELANIDAGKFGVHITTIDQNRFGIGDYKEKFSIQSISKVLSLSLAYQIMGEKIWKRVDVEPSGTQFNSLIQLEADNGIPRNPFINAGAIVIADMLIGHLGNPKEDFIRFVRNITNNPNINYSEEIASSEKKVGFRNVAICNFIKSYGNIDNNPDEVLDFYYDLCSIEMNCQEISDTFLFLSNNGLNPINKYRVLNKSQTKRMNALMQTCGFYDESGEFTFKVGVPGKSGVGGGIVAVHPDQYAIATWSPKLNKKGNSYKGMKFLETFTSETESSIF